MPQIDTTTFFPIIFATFSLYVGGYLFFNIFIFLQLFNSFKIRNRRLVFAYSNGLVIKNFLATILFFP